MEPHATHRSPLGPIVLALAQAWAMALPGRRGQGAGLALTLALALIIALTLALALGRARDWPWCRFAGKKPPQISLPQMTMARAKASPIEGHAKISLRQKGQPGQRHSYRQGQTRARTKGRPEQGKRQGHIERVKPGLGLGQNKSQR